jgi:hypothetical protein
MKPYEEIDFPNGFLRWIREDGVYGCTLTEEQMIKIKALHEAPRPWVGLTEEELYEIYDESDDGSSPCGVCGACSKCKIEVAIARAIEAKLKEKNT